MFQSFDIVSTPAQAPERLTALRAWMGEHRLNGILVPRADEHQGEYVAARSERLQWLTGFTGSAGIVLVLAKKALLFVDGRYTLQARQQLHAGSFLVEDLVQCPPSAWLRANTRKGQRIGFDPWMHTIAGARALRMALEESGGQLVALESNPIDAIWADQPEAPLEPVYIHPPDRAGELAKDKLARLVKQLRTDGVDHVVLTDPSSLAWTFNIRGNDVPHTPLALGFAVLSAKGRHFLFMDERKLDITTRAYLTQLADLREPDALDEVVSELARKGAKIGLDPDLAAERLKLLVEDKGASVVETADPARLPRATKNRTELEGARAAHRRDGAAMSTFLAWLDRQPPGSVDEISAVTRLEECRVAVGEAMQMPLRDISFPSISGAGPNGAIIHYRVTTKSNRPLQDGELYLIDSGGQYDDATTDVTRTVIVGEPSEEMRRHYTMVLKGLIAVSLLRFPPGTRGMDIDAVARMALWKAGLDYAHGTGHGVGSFLSVHEGPQRISRYGGEPLRPGMITSLEPGYYREGRYGIRIENLVALSEAEAIENGDICMHRFETLTLVPFDRRLIRIYMLSDDEHRWLDDYHARIREEIAPLLDQDARCWLEEATAPLGSTQ